MKDFPVQDFPTLIFIKLPNGDFIIHSHNDNPIWKHCKVKQEDIPDWVEQFITTCILAGGQWHDGVGRFIIEDNTCKCTRYELVNT